MVQKLVIRNLGRRMRIEDLRGLFNRALLLTFSRRKLLLVSVVLALCGLLVVFCRGLAIHAGDWVVMSLTFLPIFLCAGVLLSTGIILVRVYHDEVKNKAVNYRTILGRSWEIVIGASYFCVPIILCYLLMWMVLGVFFLLKEIPGVGEFFGVVLAFGPFLINFGSLLLCALNLAILFFVTPAVALKSVDPVSVSQIIVRRIHRDVFSNAVLMFIATLPLMTFIILLTLAALLTGTTYIESEDALHVVLQWFFIMIPFTMLLSPAVVFFFNFSAEAHVFLRKSMLQGEEE